MRTRTLLLLALGCGVAIMVSGAVLLFQLTTADEPEAPAAVGVPIEVGDMTVTVVDSTELDGALAVEISITGTPDDAPADGFRLIASGRPLTIAESTCRAFDGELQECAVSFDTTQADGTSRVLFYDRGEHGARWILAD